MEELETSVKNLMREKEELHQALQETHKLRVQNQELQYKVPDSNWCGSHSDYIQV